MILKYWRLFWDINFCHIYKYILNHLPVTLLMAAENYRTAVFTAFCPFNNSWFWVSHCGMLDYTNEFVCDCSDGCFMPWSNKGEFFSLSYLMSPVNWKKRCNSVCVWLQALLYSKKEGLVLLNKFAAFCSIISHGNESQRVVLQLVSFLTVQQDTWVCEHIIISTYS